MTARIARRGTHLTDRQLELAVGHGHTRRVRRRGRAVAALTAAAAGAALALPADAAGLEFQSLVRASLGQQQTQANEGIIDRPSISADGRYAAFASMADNLVDGDKAGWIDIFVRDQMTRTTQRINVSVSNGEADGASFAPQISGDGRYVAYESYATNLVPGDTNGMSDLFVYDRVTGDTRRISSTPTGGPATGDSADASISNDGRYVAYDSTAPDLVPGDTNDHGDVFLWDRATNRTSRISIGPAKNGSTGQGNAGSGLPSISADGMRVAFVSAASNLTPADTNGRNDIYLRDIRTGTTTLVGLGSDGRPGVMGSDAPALSAEGNHVAFHTASRLSPQDHDRGVDVYVRDLGAGTTSLVSSPVTPPRTGPIQRGISYNPSISGDGRYVAFTSFANDLVAGDLDLFQEVFLRDMLTGAVTRAAVNLNGNPGSAASFGSVLSPSGTYLAFASAAANLVADDTNETVDAFVRAIPSTLPHPAPSLGR
jgi:Tol biopolymer transport system component